MISERIAVLLSPQAPAEKEGSEKNSWDRKRGRLRGGSVSCPREASRAAREGKTLPQSRHEVTPFDGTPRGHHGVAAFGFTRKLGDISLA